MERAMFGRGASAMLLALVLATPAVAQPRSAEDQAAEHFDRGIAFFNEGRFDAALAEFSRAYELAPAHQTLYNLARVHAALGHAVESARAYEQYLAEAGDAIAPRRRREAEAALAEQRARIGHLLVRTDVDGARIAIDGVDVATTPLGAPIPVSAGSHTVEVRAPGREIVRRRVAVAGQEEVSIEVELREEVVPRGTLRVTTNVPEVTIAIDGEPVGLTPLPSTVPLRAGEHAVTASRAGYRTQTQRVVIEDGAEAELAFEMRREPNPAPDHVGRVRIRLPDAPYLIRVDGEPMIGLDLDLPVGAHRIELEVTDRQPYEGTLRIPPGGTVVITPPLSWTLEARRQRIAAAETQRSLGIGLTIT
ncbi:MAG TPA: PEGA domain-containing protein, partial [Sandaracinaceae bacterium]